MTAETQVGEKLTSPLSEEIEQDVLLKEAADRLAAATSAEERNQIVGDLACKHGLSKDRAQMLVDRFGVNRVDLEGAAQTLRERRT